MTNYSREERILIEHIRNLKNGDCFQGELESCKNALSQLRLVTGDEIKEEIYNSILSEIKYLENKLDTLRYISQIDIENVEIQRTYTEDEFGCGVYDDYTNLDCIVRILINGKEHKVERKYLELFNLVDNFREIMLKEIASRITNELDSEEW